MLPVRLPCEKMPIAIFSAAGRTLSPAVGKLITVAQSVARDLDVRTGSAAHSQKVRS